LKVATIDVGTNSTRLLIAELQKDGSVVPILKTGKVTRLGKGLLKTRRLSEESIEATLKALKEFKSLIEEHGVERVVVATTEAARQAENAREFLERVRALGYEIEILSDREEAELVFRANLKAFSPEGKAMTVDLGGGSTEVVYGSREGIELLKSLKFGVVFLQERFIKSAPPTRGELAAMEEFVRGQLLPIKEKVGESDFEVFAVGGTITSVVAMEEKMEVYDPEKVHGYKVSYPTVVKWYRLLSSLPVSERVNVVGLERRRSDVIIPGLAFFKVFCELFKKESLTVSELGLLYGLALKEAEKWQKERG
jgi:exopolyphosphatase/guanosine-5'-triphosphate,3'-diphosphate pyrophosphatase